jgi:hypothetical protein
MLAPDPEARPSADEVARLTQALADARTPAQAADDRRRLLHVWRDVHTQVRANADAVPRRVEQQLARLRSLSRYTAGPLAGAATPRADTGVDISFLVREVMAVLQQSGALNAVLHPAVKDKARPRDLSLGGGPLTPAPVPVT